MVRPRQAYLEGNEQGGLGSEGHHRDLANDVYRQR
jgi:hypothetical protein